MSQLLDTLLVTLLVVISTLSVAYSLSPLAAKKWVLSRVSHYFGIKVMTWMLPKNCGCDDCPSANKTPRLKRSIHQ